MLLAYAILDFSLAVVAVAGAVVGGFFLCFLLANSPISAFAVCRTVLLLPCSAVFVRFPFLSALPYLGLPVCLPVSLSVCVCVKCLCFSWTAFLNGFLCWQIVCIIYGIFSKIYNEVLPVGRALSRFLASSAFSSIIY